MNHMNRFEEFRALHHTSAPPLLLPNAWDHASAAALTSAGFRAIGTTSLGVASAAGKPDGTGGTRAETVLLAVGLAQLPALISADIEGGFSEQPEEVAALARGLAAAGVVGVNLEDGRSDGTLTDTGLQCELIRAVKEAAPQLFVNARTDTYWLAGHEQQTLKRIEAYQAAGADGLFVPGVRDETVISGLVGALDAPLNILYAPGGPSVRRLGELGVRRVSTGSLLFRAAVHRAVEVARGIARGDEGPMDVPSYADAQSLAESFQLQRQD